MALNLAQADDGNLSIDFLMGMLVFVLAFAYIMTAIPGIFVPYQSTSIDLGSVVYRTSSILVEDPGWYSHDGINYSNWEMASNRPYVTRVGMAIDKRSPNILSMGKIRAMKGLPYIKVRDLMGLNNSAVYNFSLKLTKVGSDEPLLNFSSDEQPGIIETMNRVVHIREGEGILINNPSQYIDVLNDTLFWPQNYMVINHNPGLSGNISVRVQGLSLTDDSQNNINVSFYYDDAHDPLDWPNFVQQADYFNHEYYIYKNGTYVDDIDDATYNTSDLIDIIIDADCIYDNNFRNTSWNFSTVRVNTANTAGCFPRNKCMFYDMSNPQYNYFDTDGIMTLRVWQI